MELMGTLIVIDDMARSRAFYGGLLGQELLFDFGENIQYKSGLSLQTRASMTDLFGVPAQKILRNSHNMELYFDEENFDAFIQKLRESPDIEYVNDKSEPTQYDWGQRTIRFYDPDGHMVEVGEPMQAVAKRFLRGGYSVGDVSKMTQLPIDYVLECAKELE